MNKVEIVEEDHLSAIGEDEEEDHHEHVIDILSTPKLFAKPPKTPSSKLMKKLLKDQFSYDRKKLIFLNANSVTLAITIFNLFSSINIEGQSSLINYQETSLIRMGDYSIYYLIFCLILVHIIKIFSCIIGFLAVHQKSERLITYYMIVSITALILRGIVTLLLIISEGTIKKVCLLIFGQDVGEFMAVQYVIVLSLFGIIEILLSLISIIQASQSREEYVRYKKYHDRLLKKQIACYEIALHTYF